MSVSTPLINHLTVLGIRTPIVVAPKAFAGGGLLASQVSLAGGFGFMAPSKAYIIAETRSPEKNHTTIICCAQPLVKTPPTGKNNHILLARPSHPSRMKLNLSLSEPASLDKYSTLWLSPWCTLSCMSFVSLPSGFRTLDSDSAQCKGYHAIVRV